MRYLVALSVQVATPATGERPERRKKLSRMRRCDCRCAGVLRPVLGARATHAFALPVLNRTIAKNLKLAQNTHSQWAVIDEVTRAGLSCNKIIAFACCGMIASAEGRLPTTDSAKQRVLAAAGTPPEAFVLARPSRRLDCLLMALHMPPQIDMSNVMAIRKEHQERFTEHHGG